MTSTNQFLKGQRKFTVSTVREGHRDMVRDSEGVKSGPRDNFREIADGQRRATGRLLLQ